MICFLLIILAMLVVAKWFQNSKTRRNQYEHYESMKQHLNLARVNTSSATTLNPKIQQLEQQVTQSGIKVGQLNTMLTSDQQNKWKKATKNRRTNTKRFK
eukprot:Pgem_evm1s18663